MGITSFTGHFNSESVDTIAKAPGGDLLSDTEIRLCAEIPMMPLHYLAAKDAIVRLVFNLLFSSCLFPFIYIYIYHSEERILCVCIVVVVVV